MQTELGGALGERLGEQCDSAGAVFAQQQRMAGQLRDPRWRCVAREARPERMPAIRALRWASTREYARRSAARAGQTAATTWSRWARRTAGGPLSSSSRSGRKTLSSGRVSTSSSRSTGAPSELMRLGWPGSKPTLSSCARGPSASSTTTRVACAPKRTSSRSLRVRGERPGAAEVERLQQVRLARAVGAVNDRQALAETGFGARIGAEVAQLHADHAHSAHELQIGHRSCVFESEMGMIR